MTTVSDLIERTRRHINTETRDEMNRLSGAIDSDDVNVAVQYDLVGIQAGATICVDLEEMHVWSASSNTAVVQRGVNGTTAAAHDSGAIVFVNPKVSAPAILGALNDQLLDMSGLGLFRVATVELTYQAGTDSYDLTGVADLTEILEVTYDANNGTSRWPAVSRSLWRLTRSMDSGDFASGMALTIDGWAEPGRPLRVAYKAPFTASMSSLAQNVESVTGLPAQMHDIPPLGAAVNLTVGGEVARNFLTQGDTRRAEEVREGSRSSMMRALAARRDERISAERARLYEKFPVVH